MFLESKAHYKGRYRQVSCFSWSLENQAQGEMPFRIS